MQIIAGCVITRNNKVLMVKEAKEECYGQWNYPAGHVEEFEKITDAAQRETFEETGCKVRLTGVLPIQTIIVKGQTHIIVSFTAEMIEENKSFNKEEILDVKWIPIEEINHMKPEELRAYKINKKTIENKQAGRIYPLEIFEI